MSTAMATEPAVMNRALRTGPPYPSQSAEAQGVNVGEVERWLSLIGGGSLAAWGLSRGDWIGLGVAGLGGALIYRGFSGHCACYEAMGIRTAEPRAASSVRAGQGEKIETSITIMKPAQELYRFWLDVENLPCIMRHLKSVEDRGNHTSRWTARGPLGFSISWDAEIHNERPNELIAWRSLEGSAVDTAGSVHFRETGRGTEVTVTLKYDPPAGKVGALVSKIFGANPNDQIAADLRRFMQVMEAGEFATTEGQPRGRCG